MKEKNSFFSGALFVVISALLVKIIGVIYKIPLSYILSDDGMSYFNTAYTVFSFFYIVTGAGVPKALSILISSREVEGDFIKRGRIYKSAIRFFTLLGFIFTFLLILLANPLSVFLNSRNAALSIISIAPSVFFVSASAVMRGYFTGKMRFIPCAVSELVASALKLVLGLIFALVAKELTESSSIISAATILGTSIGAYISYLYLYINTKSEAETKLNIPRFGIFTSELKTLLSLLIPLSLGAFISSLGSVFDLAIFMRALTKDGYTEYQTSVIFGNYSTLVLPMLSSTAAIISPVLLLIIPLVGRMDTNQALAPTVNLIIKISCAVSAHISAVLLFFGSGALDLLFEESSAILAAPVLSYLSPGIYLMSLLTVINTVLEGRGNVKIPLISLSLAVALKGALSSFLLKNDLLGTGGAAASISISYLFAMLLSLIYFKFKGTRQIHVILPGILAITFSLVSCAVTSVFFSLVNLDFLFLKLALSSLLFLIFVLFLILNDKEKGEIWSKLTKKSI